MKKILLLFFSFIIIFTLTGCNKETIPTDAIKFKEEYESLNGISNSSEKVHRIVSIDKNNPFVYTTPEEIIQKIENEETFYVYFGSKLCPWCRSVIEKVIEVANEKDIKTIYYIDIWDDEGNEIFRDSYKLENDTLIKTFEGTKSYYKLLTLFDNILSDYNLSNSEGNKIDVGEKRIYAPNFIYVEHGKALKITEAISKNQEDSFAELTEEILKDEEEQLKEFFD